MCPADHCRYVKECQGGSSYSSFINPIVPWRIPVQKVHVAPIKWMARQNQPHGERCTARLHAGCVVLQRVRRISCVQTRRPHQNQAKKLLGHFAARTGSALLPLCHTHPSFFSERREIDSSSQVQGGCQFFSFKMQPGSWRSTSEVPPKTSQVKPELSWRPQLTAASDSRPWALTLSQKTWWFFHPFRRPHMTWLHHRPGWAVFIPFLSQELLAFLEIVNTYFKVLFREHFTSELWGGPSVHVLLAGMANAALTC